MTRILIIFVAVAGFALNGGALAQQAYDQNGVPLQLPELAQPAPQMPQTPQAITPAEQPSTTEVAPPQAPVVAAPVAPAEVDPCLAYMSSYDAYTMCQDRMQKIQRMKDAKAKRGASPPVAAPQTPQPAPVAPDQAQTQESPAQKEYITTNPSGFIINKIKK